MTKDTLPRWDLTSIYPALDSAAFARDERDLTARLEELAHFVQAQHIHGSAPAEEDAAHTAEVISGYLERLNIIQRLYRTLGAYCGLIVSVDSYNTAARKKQSELEQLGVRMHQQMVPFQAWLGKRRDLLESAIARGGAPAEHAFLLRETARLSQYLMSESEEALASELGLSGATAWGKLQGTVVSQVAVEFERHGASEKLPITAIINLHSDADGEIRRRAYEAELKAWETVREPLAAAMNGIKGSANTLARRRGRQSVLDVALDQARIDRPTLDAMMGAMQESFPAFRRYFLKKAARFGHAKLPWWDLFAPAGQAERQFTWQQAQEFILTHFARFSGELASFARNAFEKRWIDAEPRQGKRGGAFCMGIPAVEESRIMANYDGSLDQTFTLAHELGHGFHNYCMKGKLPLLRATPMTLAETASTFCETLVTDAVLAESASAAEQLAILETYLIGSSQVIVDISSRFLFEQEVLERRASAELSADDLCEIMQRAQQATYGEGLDERYLHPYMWTWKPHYYMPNLNFYNFPYAFGLLFGTGLYAIYQQRGEGFIEEYKALLASTGEADAATLAARFGIDIRTPAFWKEALSVIEQRIERYLEL